MIDAVEKPASKIMYCASRSDIDLGLGLGDVALADRALPDLVGVDPGAVVGDLDDDAVALLARAESATVPCGGLAQRDARRRVLDAVIDRVAHDVDERVVDLLEHLLVEFGVAALDDEVDVLAELLGQVAHGARETPGRSCWPGSIRRRMPCSCRSLTTTELRETSSA